MSETATARQIWITAPNQVELREFPIESPGTGQVLLETESTLVSAGTELAIVTGTHIGFSTGAAWPRYPMALGYTAVGRIRALGDGVSGWRVGDRVFANTPHASTATADAASLQRLPDDAPAEAVLLAHLAAIALNGVRLAHPRLGEGMIVFGQGLIGALAARLGRAAGCRPVVGVDPLPERRALAERAGIIPVDPAVADPGAVHRAHAQDRLPDVVIEATGAPEVIEAALRSAGEMARVVLLGSPRGRVEIDPYSNVHRPGVSIVGAHERTAPAVATPHNPFTRARNRQDALTLIQDGTISTDGLISHHIRPDDLPATYQALAARAPGYMGVIINWRGG